MIKYEEIENSMGDKVILRYNEDGSVTSFMAESANSDYQAYLNRVEHLTENPTEDVE